MNAILFLNTYDFFSENVSRPKWNFTTGTYRKFVNFDPSKKKFFKKTLKKFIWIIKINKFVSNEKQSILIIYRKFLFLVNLLVRYEDFFQTFVTSRSIKNFDLIKFLIGYIRAIRGL